MARVQYADDAKAYMICESPNCGHGYYVNILDPDPHTGCPRCQHEISTALSPLDRMLKTGGFNDTIHDPAWGEYLKRVMAR